ncbi:Hsp20/alpha crystallin family protein [Acidaminobacter hydrogenoformans]|uniref:HSP20 family protein n=1 Tax=Acidaminobacter hydrogenoformans DSM 2784 TaxID=1120920 RepID=A0A1G5RU58_9FIRM|nr:Hsp20/alpha crystallin family protein [Acidaminobacter hydrogenoformans]SCZ77665.1 HSP20 family protein [Acidaminobacter hydrogenoformans DSM 2784]
MAGLVPFNQRRSNLTLRPRGFDDFTNMLDDFFSDSWMPGRSLMRDTFKLDVEEAEDHYKIEADLPGIKKEEVSLDMNEGRLTISIKREEKTDEEKKNYVHQERRVCSMQRTIYLGDAGTEDIKARLEDGVLNIVVPKVKKTELSKKIEIE